MVHTHTDTHTRYSDQVSMEPTRYRQDGLTRITGMEDPPGRTCSLKTCNRRLRTAALAEVIAVSQTSIGLVNIWNISFILLFFFFPYFLIWERSFMVKVFFRVRIIASRCLLCVKPQVQRVTQGFRPLIHKGTLQLEGQMITCMKHPQRTKKKFHSNFWSVIVISHQILHWKGFCKNVGLKYSLAY